MEISCIIFMQKHLFLWSDTTWCRLPPSQPCLAQVSTMIRWCLSRALHVLSICQQTLRINTWVTQRHSASAKTTPLILGYYKQQFQCKNVFLYLILGLRSFHNFSHSLFDTGTRSRLKLAAWFPANQSK